MLNNSIGKLCFKGLLILQQLPSGWLFIIGLSFDITILDAIYRLADEP